MRLDRKISIRRISENSRNTYGEVVPVTSLVANVWAEINTGAGFSSKEKKESDKETPINSTMWTIRYRSGLKESDYITYENIIYDIKAIKEIGRRQYLQLVCEDRDQIDLPFVVLEDGDFALLEDGTNELLEG